MTAVAKVATRFTVDAMATARRSPFFELTPGAPLSGTEVRVPSDRFTSRALRNDSFEGALGFTSQFTRRSSIGATVSRRDTRFPESSGYNYSGWGARGDFRHGLSRNATLHLGYGREDARQQSLGEGRYVHEMIHVGVDLDRSISLARRTALSFYTQPSVLRESGGPRRFRLNGGVTLRRDFGRTWNASLLVNRDTEFHPGFVAPLFSHGGGLSIGGLLAKRVEWTSNVGARRGQLGFDGTSSVHQLQRLFAAVGWASRASWDSTASIPSTTTNCRPARPSSNCCRGTPDNNSRSACRSGCRSTRT